MHACLISRVQSTSRAVVPTLHSRYLLYVPIICRTLNMGVAEANLVKEALFLCIQQLYFLYFLSCAKKYVGGQLLIWFCNCRSFVGNIIGPFSFSFFFFNYKLYISRGEKGKAKKIKNKKRCYIKHKRTYLDILKSTTRVGTSLFPL